MPFMAFSTLLALDRLFNGLGCCALWQGTSRCRLLASLASRALPTSRALMKQVSLGSLAAGEVVLNSFMRSRGCGCCSTRLLRAWQMWA
ncbi:hypothetical protein V8C86DRAFT_2774789 [Haematococcus lacustris]